MKFTLVSTVFNEFKRLPITLDDLTKQTVRPSEIVITDAGSNDGTLELLYEWQQNSEIPIKIIVEPRCNVAKGRNIAILNATYDLIVSTDFGCRFHPDWLYSLIRPFEDSTIEVSCGNYTVIENEQISPSAKAAYIITGGYKSNISSPNFIPSSRSIAYKKYVFEEIGGYPEWLTLTADDSVFGQYILRRRYKMYKSELAYVYWGRHTSFKGYQKEAFRYGLGEGEARIGIKHNFKNWTQLFSRYIFVLYLIYFLFIGIQDQIPLFFDLAILFITSIGFRQYYLYVLKNWLAIKSDKYDLRMVVHSVLLFETIQLNYLKGYIKGYFFSTSTVKLNAKNLTEDLSIH